MKITIPADVAQANSQRLIELQAAERELGRKGFPTRAACDCHGVRQRLLNSLIEHLGPAMKDPDTRVCDVAHILNGQLPPSTEDLAIHGFTAAVHRAAETKRAGGVR